MEAGFVVICGVVGVFLTHRAFAKFIIGVLQAKRAIAAGGDFSMSTSDLARETISIVVGLLPLGYAIIRFVHWAWNNSVFE